LVRLVSVWVLLWVSLFRFIRLLVSPSPRLCLVFIIGFICSPGFSFVRLRLGFIIRFALVLLVSPSRRLCLVSFVLLVSPSPRLCLVFIMGFIGGWELCQYRWTNCYESQEDEGADIKGEP
jgi:hypothetical protein